MLTRTEKLFFELLRIALGTQETLIGQLSDEEWLEVSQMAVKQSVLGILYTAVEKLPEAQRPPTDLFIDMYQCVQEIEDRNRHMNKMTALVSSRFRKDGFPNCILKGQGIALLYPNPLRRQSGDIDIWLKGERKEILKYIKTYVKNTEPAGYLHIGFSLKDGTLVEAHFTPAISFNPFINHRLQRWFKANIEQQIHHFVKLPNVDKEIPVPTPEFNTFQILQHTYKHLFNGGIHIRQLIDFFYVLQSLQTVQNSSSLDLKRLIKKFKLKTFYSAMFWILTNQLGFNSDYTLYEPDEKEGQYLLQEILHPQRQSLSEDELEKLNNRSRFFHLFYNVHQLLFHYPYEVLFYPLHGIPSTIKKLSLKRIVKQ